MFGPARKRTRNKFDTRCWDCGRHLRPDEGYLDGRDETDSWWVVRCDECLGIEPDGPYVNEETLFNVPPWDPPPPPRPGPKKSNVTLPACMLSLGLVPPVDRDAVKRAYRAKAQRVHPDHGGDPADFRRLYADYESSLRLVESCPHKWR